MRIDDALVVDNSGNHATQTKSGQVVLARGPHPVTVEYVQAGGVYELEWQWSHDRSAPEQVPESALSPYRIGHATMLLIRLLDVLFAPALAGVGAIVLWTAFPPKSRFTTWPSSG